ncbi:MAG: PAS domain S-box protein [Candidatus Levyibacteriota bacterium]
MTTEPRPPRLRDTEEPRAIEVEKQIEIGGEPRTRVEQAMRRAALAVSAAEGEALFADLVRSLAEILAVDIAFIALPSPADARRLRMLAFYVDGRMIEDFEYALAGTPCEQVLGQEYRFFPCGLAERFPLDEGFRRLGVDAYAGYPLTGTQGRALGLIAVVSRRTLADPHLVEAMLKIFATRAVTEIDRRRADEALRASEEQYRAIFNASADALVLWDSRYRRVDVNPAYERLYGWARDEVIGCGYEHPAFTPEYARPRLELVRRALAGEACHAELEAIRKNGERVPTEIHAIPFQHRGEPHVLTIARDITERKRAEHALRTSEEQYRAIFNASTDALILWDSRFRRVDVNPAYEKMYGWTRDEAIGGGYERPEYPAEYARPREELVRRALAGETARAELEAIRKNGERIQTEVVTIPFRHRGEPHVLAIARDITERKRAESERYALEAQLRQAQKMEAIGHLTGGIAHDFNNILSGILGYIVLAGERDAAAADPKLRQYLDQAQRASLRGRDLIQQMLTFSRGKRGEPRRLDLPSLVHDALKLIGPTLPSSIVLDVDLGRPVPAVSVDPVQAEQVLLNLLINARDATGGAGTIGVRVDLEDRIHGTCASCRKRVEGRYVGLTVRDSGTGIAGEAIDRIFDPFFTTKGIGKGSGMGLSVVHGIVHECSGHILVDSIPGAGATFRVLFPPIAKARADSDAETAVPDAAAPRAAPMSGRVLVVDDEPMVGEFIGELLTTRGLDVTVKSDPVEAALWFAADPDRVDLILTDQTMPRMTGLELAERATTERPELPVILCTGYGGDIGPNELRRHGVAAMLRKPVEPAALTALIASHLAQG